MGRAREGGHRSDNCFVVEQPHEEGLFAALGVTGQRPVGESCFSARIDDFDHLATRRDEERPDTDGQLRSPANIHVAISRNPDTGSPMHLPREDALASACERGLAASDDPRLQQDVPSSRDAGDSSGKRKREAAKSFGVCELIHGFMVAPAPGSTSRGER